MSKNINWFFHDLISKKVILGQTYLLHNSVSKWIPFLGMDIYKKNIHDRFSTLMQKVWTSRNGWRLIIAQFEVITAQLKFTSIKSSLELINQLPKEHTSKIYNFKDLRIGQRIMWTCQIKLLIFSCTLNYFNGRSNSIYFKMLNLATCILK